MVAGLASGTRCLSSDGVGHPAFPDGKAFQEPEAGEEHAGAAPSQWLAVMQRMERTLDQRFRRLEHLLRSLHGPPESRSGQTPPDCDPESEAPGDAAGCDPRSDAEGADCAAGVDWPAEDWKQSIAASLRHIEAMLERQASCDGGCKGNVVAQTNSLDGLLQFPGASATGAGFLNVSSASSGDSVDKDERLAMSASAVKDSIINNPSLASASSCSIGSPLRQPVPPVRSMTKSSMVGRHHTSLTTHAAWQRFHWQIVVQDQVHAVASRRDSGQIPKRFWKSFFGLLEWWMFLQEPPRTNLLSRVIRGRYFEMLCSAVILANATFAAHTVNYEITYLRRVPHVSTLMVESGFLGFYMLELALKLVVHRLYYFCNDDMRWNLFDLFLVLFSVYEMASTTWAQQNDNIDFTHMRTLRIMKMARILRVMRMAKIFSELRLMLNSIIGSFISLFWSFMMLAFVFFIFGLCFVQGAAAYLETHINELDPGDVRKVKKAFGSVGAAMLSLYKATTGGADWEDFYDSPIMERMGTLNCVLFIFLIAFIQVALLNILTGMFVESALKLAQPDRETQALEYRKKELIESAELRQICERMDTDRSGTISPDEFRKNITNGRLRAHMHVLGLHIKDVETFYDMFMARSDNNAVTIDDFVTGCMQMRGNATALDQHTVLHAMNVQNQHMMHFLQACERHLAELAQKTEATGNLADQ